MKTILIPLFFITSLFAQLSPEVFKSAIAKSQLGSDSTWIEMTQMVHVQGQQIKSLSKFIKLGDNEKIETKNQVMHQVIVKSKGEIKIKDMKSGKVHSQKLPDGATAAPGLSVDKIWGNGDFKAPVQEGDLWKLESNSNLGDEQLESRILWYNPSTAKIEKFKEVRVDGLTTETSLEYCSDCNFKDVPRKMIINGKQGNISVKTEIEITKFEKINSMLPSFFDLK